MAKNPLAHSEELYEYLKILTLRETAEQVGLREATAEMSESVMQISPDQGQFMAMLVKLIDANNIVEVGTFTGYSALAMALALPPDGRLIACDVSSEWTGVGRPYWEKAGVSDRIDLRIGPAMDTLDQLLANGMAGKVDLVFIDADKVNYRGYYDRAIQLVRENGLIIIDNVFWGGSVIDESDTSEDTECIREVNRLVAADDRVDVSMISIGDGLMLARKR